MILQIITQAKDMDRRAEAVKRDFRTKKLSVCNKQYPQIAEFPVPIQKLLAGELDALEARIAAGKPTPNIEDASLTCYCRFSGLYCLPCRHIFHLDSSNQPGIILAGDRWNNYIQ